MKKININDIIEMFKVIDAWDVHGINYELVKTRYENDYDGLMVDLTELYEKLAHHVLDMVLSEIDYEDHIIPRFVESEKEKTYITFDNSFVRYNNILDNYNIFLQPYMFYSEKEPEEVKEELISELKEVILKAENKIKYTVMHTYPFAPEEEDILKKFELDPSLDVVIVEDYISAASNGGYGTFEGKLYIRNQSTIEKYRYTNAYPMETYAKTSNSIKEFLREIQPTEWFEGIELLETF